MALKKIAINRVHGELKEWQSSEIYKHYSVIPNEDSVFQWTVNVNPSAMKDTQYAKKKFSVIVDFPNTYPNNPPQIHLYRPLYHPNVTKDGVIVIPQLRVSEWKRNFKVLWVLDIAIFKVLAGTPILDCAPPAMQLEYTENPSLFHKNFQKSLMSWENINKPPSNLNVQITTIQLPFMQSLLYRCGISDCTIS